MSFLNEFFDRVERFFLSEELEWQKYNTLILEGSHEEALPIAQLAVDSARRAVGETHPSFAVSLKRLAWLHEEMGQQTQAEPLHRQAQNIYDSYSIERSEAPPVVAANLNSLALLCLSLGKVEDALQNSIQSTTVSNDAIGQVFSQGSEKQWLSYLQTVYTHSDMFHTLLSQHFATRVDAVQAGFNLVLRRKALVAEGTVIQRDALLSGRYPDLVPKQKALDRLIQQIGEKRLAGTDDEGEKRYQQKLAEWGQQQDEMQADISRHIPEMNIGSRLQGVSVAAVARALPPKTALIEFIRFNIVDFKFMLVHGASVSPSRYLAFILHADQPNSATLIDLGESEPIEQLLAALRTTITREAEDRGLYYGDETPDDHLNLEKNGRSLREKIFDPLLSALDGCHRLFISPDGDLSRLPFEILPLADDQCLINTYEISYLSAGRDLLRLADATSLAATRPVIVAAPDYDLALNQIASQNDSSATLSKHRSRGLVRSDLHFTPLHGARKEGEQLSKLLQVRALLGAAATESKLKSYRSPYILHIATHGFFLPAQADEMGRFTQNIENPLLRSGLALAGANTWHKQEQLPADAEDAMLNGADVLGMDLQGTEMVVLSACETGLGEIQAGEGVFGLRRAFVLAGAKTLIMSLWKVPDQQTQELMVDFYEHVLAGMPRAEALRQAQLTMKQKHSNPRYWGAFICQGASDPLPKLPYSSDHSGKQHQDTSAVYTSGIGETDIMPNELKRKWDWEAILSDANDHSQNQDQEQLQDTVSVHTSGMREISIMPDELKRKWNWGASLLLLIWTLSHYEWYYLKKKVKRWMFVGISIPAFFAIFLQIAPIVAAIQLVAILLFVMVGFFVFGIKGNQWAWRTKQWDDVEHFQRIQKRWRSLGCSIYIVIFFLLWVLSLS